jgi:hypothetical protein
MGEELVKGSYISPRVLGAIGGRGDIHFGRESFL